MDGKFVVAKVADTLGLNFRCSRENFLAPLVGKIWSIKSQHLAVMTTCIAWKQDHHECVNEMIHPAIVLSLKPLRFQHMMIAR